MARTSAAFEHEIAHDDQTTAAVYTLPVAIYITVLRLLRRSPERSKKLDALFTAAVLAILGSTFWRVPS